MIRCALAFALAAGPLAAHPVAVTAGATLSCASADGGPNVHVWVGIAESWADHGVTGPTAAIPIFHVQLAVPGAAVRDVVGHMPFEAVSLHDCAPISALSFEPDPDALREGYEIWSAAVADGAVAFVMPPGEAYAYVLSIRDEGQ